MSVRFVEYVRGPLVESVHYGVAAVVAPDGKVISSAGDTRLVSYYRSASKPIQAIPLVESGAADRFGLTPQEIAVVCGSHSGEPVHIAVVSSIFEKIGLSPDALLCGIQVPFSRVAARERAAAGLEPDQLCNNCSGKHAGMLALCAFHGWPTAGYTAPNHPVQQLMGRTVADFCGIQPDEIYRGVDGCSVVTFGVSTYHMALSFARLVDPPADWTSARRDACRRIVEAMLAYPEMVAGTQGRLDTDLMRSCGGTLIAKSGAEAVYCMARLPEDGKPGVGLALKLEDGDEGGRSRDPAVMRLLEEAGLLDSTLRARFPHYVKPLIRNRAGLEVGEVRAVFNLHKPRPGVHMA